jgi:hypothetical protein
MTTLFLEMDQDTIYELLEETQFGEIEDEYPEYREDRMEQMISRHGY